MVTKVVTFGLLPMIPRSGLQYHRIAQKARLAKRISNDQIDDATSAHNVSSSSQEDRGLSAGEIGKSKVAEEGRLAASAGRPQLSLVTRTLFPT
jgi:hypothetical protein